MRKYLLVEDSPIVVKIIQHIGKTDTDIPCDIATSFSEAKELLTKNGKDHYLVAVVDLNLPDAPNGEVVDYTIKQHIPTIVLTGNFDETKQEEMTHRPIVDYVIKESRFSYEYVIKLINRLEKNQDIKILVVDDSRTSRNHIANLLRTHLYQVHTANDGDEALEILEQHSDIKLMITDYNMPKMNGFDLVKNIRKEVSKNDLVIIGLSTEGNVKLSAKFIKNGANDFLNKPFSHEEFHCRILHNIESLEYAQTMKHMAYHDFVTGLPNKQKFFIDGAKELEMAHEQNAPVSLALISIDHIHNIQDKYGLDAPDTALKSLSTLLPKAFGRFHFAKINDSDIAVLMAGLKIDQAAKLINGFREIVEDHIVLIDETNFSFTVSAGITDSPGETLISLLKQADNRLYLTREEGDNSIGLKD